MSTPERLLREGTDFEQELLSSARLDVGSVRGHRRTLAAMGAMASLGTATASATASASAGAAATGFGGSGGPAGPQGVRIGRVGGGGGTGSGGWVWRGAPSPGDASSLPVDFWP